MSDKPVLVHPRIPYAPAYYRFLQEMQARLSWIAESGPQGEDFALALLRAWAAAGEVIHFYQRRFEAEGFTSTATEEESQRALLYTIHQTPPLPIGAGVYLAFQLQDTPNTPSQVLIPGGTAVQNVPEPDQHPQIFETAADLYARPEWSSLPLAAPLPASPTLAPGATSLVLQGVATRLKPGDPLLILGSPAGATTRQKLLVWLGAVESDAGAGSTRVSWEGSGQSERLESLEVYALRQQTPLFGHNAPEWSTLSNEAKQAQLPPRVTLSVLSGKLEEKLPVTLNTPVSALAVDDAQNIFIGTREKGVFGYSQGAGWVARSRGFLKQDIQVLISNPRGHLFAGTSGGGVYRSEDRGQTWQPLGGSAVAVQRGEGVPDTTVRALLSYEDGDGNEHLLAGTDDGVFYTAGSTRIWRQANRGLPETNKINGFSQVSVFALTADTQRGHLFAGTDRGLFACLKPGAAWQPGNKGLPEAPVRGLVAYQGHLLALVDQRLFYSSDSGRRWSERAIEGPVQRLALRSGSTLLAATTRGVFQSTDHGVSWTKLFGASSECLALTGDTRDGVYALTQVQTPLPGEWPGFALERDALALGRHVPQVVPGGWLVLYQKEEEGEARALFYQIKKSDIASVQLFTLKANVNLLSLEGEEIPDTVSRRRAIALVQSEKIELYQKPEPEKIFSDTREITLKSKVTLNNLPKKVFVVGSKWQSPREKQAELVQVESIKDAGDNTVLYLSENLKEKYNWSTVRILANVVFASHGQTILREPIGSLIPSEKNSKYSLRRKHIFLTATEDGAGEKNLSIEVNGALWQEVSSLGGSLPADQHFVARAGKDGKTEITFGDGIEGARPPSGVGNILATYRSGDLPSGAAAAGSITLLRQRPPGVHSVTNPLPAVLAQPTQAPDLQIMAARALQSDTLLSLRDVEDFCVRFAEVRQAQASLVPSGGGAVLQVTVLWRGTAPKQAVVSLTSALSAHLHEPWSTALSVAEAEILSVTISGTVHIAPVADTRTVASSIRALLSDELGTQKRWIGQGLTTTEVRALLQRVPGVAHIRGLVLSLEEGAEESLEIPARSARWEDGQIRPAQQVVLSPDGLALSLVKTHPSDLFT